MAKIFELAKIKNRNEKAEKILEYLMDIKDSLADVIGEFENAGDDESADGLTEALNALEDACDAIDEVLE